MTDIIAALGKAAPDVVIVLLFLYFLDRRDKSWQTFIKQILADKEKPIEELVKAIQEFRSEFVSHDAWEHTRLDEMEKAQKERTKPTRGPKP